MNKFLTIIALIALAMLAVSPASADGVWHNEKYFGTQEALDEYLDGAKVIHNPKTGVDSKYRDTNPAKSPEVYAGQNSCYLEGNIRAGYNTLTKEVLLSNVLAPDTSITIPILPDGTFRYDGLAHGEYTLYIDDGNGGQPEYSRVICNGNGVVRPVNELLGHAVSGDPAKVEAESEPGCKPIVVKASDIYKGRFGGYWFNLKVRGTNEDVFQIAHVTVIDSEDHTLLSAHVIVYGTNHYTVPVWVPSSHKNHNPLTVTVDDSICKEPCQHRNRGGCCGSYREGIVD